MQFLRNRDSRQARQLGGQEEGWGAEEQLVDHLLNRHGKHRRQVKNMPVHQTRCLSRPQGTHFEEPRHLGQECVEEDLEQSGYLCVVAAVQVQFEVDWPS